MPRPPRRASPPQIELFADSAPPLGREAPAWTTLPEQTRRVLTVLVMRLLVDHAGAQAREGGDDDV